VEVGDVSRGAVVESGTVRPGLPPSLDKLSDFVDPDLPDDDSPRSPIDVLSRSRDLVHARV